MNSKKAITLLVLATLIMTLVPLVPVQAITVDVDDDTVTKGQEVEVSGDGVPGGRTINIYWDDMEKETFSAGSGKIASTMVKRDQSYEVEVTIPEGIYGDHYIYVKDTVTGYWEYVPVFMNPEVSVSSSSGLEGEKITVTGSGYNYDEDDEEGLDINIWVDDDYGTEVTSFRFTPETPETNVLGSWTATFSVPDEDYGDYTIWAEDSDTNIDDVVFTIGASITLNIEEGPVGSVVTISGRGFDDGEEDVTVWLDGTLCEIVSGGTVRSDGRITTKIVIPSIAKADYEIEVYDEVGGMPVNTAYADFEVNGVAEVEATPEYGTQGSAITVEGWNFTKISNTEVTVTLNDLGSKTYKTDSQGYFKGTFTIPAIGTDDTAELKAVDEYNIEATSNVRVGIMLVILTPGEAASGGVVSITGVGFLDLEPYTASIGDEEWFTGTTDGVGTIVEIMNVPTMAPGTYTVTIMEDDSEIEVTATLVITHKTMVELNPVSAPNEYAVVIEGYYFAEEMEDWDPTLEFILYNATSEWILEVWYDEDGNGEWEDGAEATVELGLDEDWDDGYFEGTFIVSDDEVLSLGTYMMNITDGQGMFAQVTLDIVSKITTIMPKRETFRIGETVAFKVESSFKSDDAYVKIRDPSGNLYWTTDKFTTDNWIKVGTVQIYPFYEQVAGGNPMVLLEDAPLGTYTWIYYDEYDDILDSGTLAVAAAATDVLGQQIEDLNQAVTDLQTDVTTVSTEMAGVRTQITNAINAANAAVQAANAATQAVNAVATTASAASTAATNAANAATEAKNAANGLTTLVYGAIGASLVAALAAIVSLMQISRRIAG